MPWKRVTSWRRWLLRLAIHSQGQRPLKASASKQGVYVETRNEVGRNLVQAGVFLLWPGTSQSYPENHSFLKSFRGESELTKYT